MVVLFTVGLFVFNGCSTKKTGWAHRTYHSILTRFNGYYNATEIMKQAEFNIDQALPDDYTQTLPVYKELPEEQIEVVSSDMDIVIEKCARVVRKNSIKKRGKEYTKWIDDCFLLMGKAYYYKQDDAKAFTLLNQASKKFKDEQSKYEARFWLARLYARQENYDKAQKILTILENDNETPDYLRMDMRKLSASIFLAEGNTDSGIDEIRRAITVAKPKTEKMRLTYLLGQLLREQDERQESMAAFKQVLKMHPEYELEFYTRIQMAMSYGLGTGGAEEVRKELLKMLKDEKYIEFQDQIYYALAEMSYSENDVPETLEYLHKSTEVSEGNDKQKTTSFLRLGQIYFARPEYQKAQANYDSCVTYMPENYPNAEEIRKISNNLKDLVTQILIIERQDSLQRVAKMDPKERNKLIDNLIQTRIQEEEQKLLNEQLRAEALAGAIPGSSPGAGPAGFGGSAGAVKWYFYNPTQKETGATDFARIWGKRKNEDNWRRSSKEQVFDDAEELANGDQNDGFYVDDSGDTVQISGDWMNASFYLKDLPFTEEQVTKSDEKIVEAYYALSIIYKEQMEDIPAAIQTLIDLNNRFSSHKYTVDSYYRLYRMYLDEGELSESNYYKNKILNEFPDSQYAQIIKDPNFLEKENADYNTATKIYQKAYVKYYQRGYYQQTIETCNQILAKYGHTQIKPKAMFLRALAIGHEKGEAALVTELEIIAKQYPNDEYGQRANELIEGLQIKKEEELAKLAEADKEKAMAIQADEMQYILDNSSKHNFVILVKAKGKELSAIKSKISDFNRLNYKMEGLKMSAVVYGKGYQMVTVKSFNNAKAAKNYQIAFENNSKLADVVKDHSDYFIVNFTNYALFFKSRDHVNYKIWSDIKYKDL